MASAMTVAAQTAQVPNTWNSAKPWEDSDLTVAWDKHWNSDTHKLENATNADQPSNWMADLPDNILVAHVSIPGAHDFATGEKWASSTGKKASTTQAATMCEQLDLGIRALDFRPGLGDDDGVIYCNHGSDQTEITLEQAMTWLDEFLTKHPSEFFIIHLFRGNVYASKPDGLTSVVAKYSEKDKQEYNEKVGKILNEGVMAKRVIDFRPNLKVGDVRGRIVLLRRDRINFLDLPKAGYMDNWTTEFNYDNPGTVYNASYHALTTKIHMQDLSEGDNDVVWKKQEHCKAMIEKLQSLPTPNEAVANGEDEYKCEWWLNFTSIENSGNSNPLDNTNGYKGGASLMNPYMLTLLTGIDGEGNKVGEPILGKGPIGIYFSDYVIRHSTEKDGASSYRYVVRGDELVYKIIENNFAGDNPPVVKYALNENPVWNKEYSNPYDGQRVYFRHKATRQWLCGGANYGSHLALDNHGYYFTISLNPTTGEVTLSNPGGKKVEANPYFWVDHDNATAFKLVNGKQPNTYVLAFEHDGVTKAATVKAYAPKGSEPNPYADNLDYFVDPEIYVYGDTHQEFEMVSYEERLAELENKANPERPYSATFLVPAYSFGNGWTGINEFTFESKYKAGLTYDGNAKIAQRNSGNGAFAMIYNLSNNRAGFKSKWNLDRKITGLPNGKYKVDFQAFSWNQYDEGTKYNIGGKQGSISDSQALDDVYNAGKKTNDFLSKEIFQKLKATDANGNEYEYEKNNIDPILDEFKAGTGKYTLEDIIVNNGELSIHFDMQYNKASETAFFLDNIHLTYYGPEKKAEETVQVNFPEHWNTVILPFDVSESYISSNVNKDGKNYIFYQVDKEKGGYKETSKELQENQYKPYYYHVVQLSDAVSSLKANTPYIVENLKVEEVEPKPEEIGTETQSAFAAPARAAATDNTYLETFVGHPTNYEDTYTDAGNFLTGVLTDNYTIDEGHYPLVKANYQMFAQLTDAQTAPVAKYHAYVHSGAETAEHPIILFKDVDNVLTGVEDVAAEGQGITEETPVDVYTTGGVLVRSQVATADALTDLPRGIYILAAPQGALKVAK